MRVAEHKIVVYYW